MKLSEELMAKCACTRIRTASRVLTRAYDDMLRPTGLKASQLAVLAAVDSIEAASIVELSKILFMDRTTLSRNLKPLVAEKLITMHEDGWGRSKTVQLTKIGQEKLQSSSALWQKAQAEVAKRIGDDHWQAMDQQLQDLIAAY
jgi:DNA-binding MarR family transcriptional regulator